MCDAMASIKIIVTPGNRATLVSCLVYTTVTFLCLSYILINTFATIADTNDNHNEHGYTINSQEDYTVDGVNPGVYLSKGVCTKGKEPWSRAWIMQQIPVFLKVYENRPGENYQGTPMMHQFAMWCIVNMLRPRHIIESGVWNGRGTWLLRQAAPEAQIIVLDPKPRYPMAYVDNKTDTLYFIEDTFRDFGTLADWTDVKLDVDHTLAFIDDHQTPFKRIPEARRAGIKHMIFEDNYWLGYADCLSLKQGCACVMRETECALFKYRDNWSHVVRDITRDDLSHVASTFRDLDIYAEFPAMWNVYSKSVTMVSAKSRNYLFNVTNGVQLVKSLGLSKLPPWIQFNGFYSYCNIAYVRL